MDINKQKYVLITPAHNEEAFIEGTIMSIASQSFKPDKWIIVNNNSNDNTENIINYYANNYKFICTYNFNNDSKHNFGNKVFAFNYARAKINLDDYDFIGNLDADVTLTSNYFEFLIYQFMLNKKLGISGGHIYEKFNASYFPQTISNDSVAGAVQFFKMDCFKNIGSLMPNKTGGVDIYPEVLARYHGWEVKTFSELKVEHHRPVSVNVGNIYKVRFYNGMNHYLFGYDMIFEFFKCIYRIKSKPLILGSIFTFFGYLYMYFSKSNRKVDPKVTEFLKKEQRSKLFKSVFK